MVASERYASILKMVEYTELIGTQQLFGKWLERRTGCVYGDVTCSNIFLLKKMVEKRKRILGVYLNWLMEG